MEFDRALELAEAGFPLPRQRENISHVLIDDGGERVELQ